MERRPARRRCAISCRLSPRWLAEGTYSYLAGNDLHPTRPVRRLPAQQGFLSIRYQPGARLTWIGVSAYLAGAQENFSGGSGVDAPGVSVYACLKVLY